MKKNFAEPKMDVVRFNAQEIVIATSCSDIEIIKRTDDNAETE